MQMLAMLINKKQLACVLFLTAAICSAAATFSGPANITWEAERLLEVKQGLGQTEDSLSEWRSANLAEVCHTWQGVVCSADNTTVTTLNFTGFDVSGELTSPLCQLPNLAELRIRSNSINQSFPEFIIQSCRELKVLDFSLNFFHGQLPVNISAHLSTLQQFNMEGNYFEGPIPADLGNLPQLRFLRLRGNSLTGLIPPNLGRLSLLEILDLSWNYLIPGEIPHELGNLTSLKELDLPSCNLIGEIPASFGNFFHLWFFDLSVNSLSGPIPPSLANLSNLTELYLFENRLSGPLPPLSNLPKLTTAQFHNNSLSGPVPAGFASLSSLNLLRLDYNQLTGSLPDGLASIPALSTFVASHNRLSGTLPTQWGLNSTLFQLDVTNNAFTGPFPPHLCARNGLNYLSLKNNLISGEIPAEYESCKSMLRFIVDGNQLSGSVPSGLWALPSVQIIMLRNNLLSGKIILSNYDPSAKHDSLDSIFIESNQFEGPIPSLVGQFWPNLAKLSASGNKLSGPLPAEIGRLSYLHHLDLSFNSISGSLPPQIGRNSSLVFLDLSENLISGPVGNWSGLSNLEYLDLSKNSISGPLLPLIGRAFSLIALHLSENFISGPVPPEIGNLSDLQFLYLSKNSISGPLPPEIGSLSELGILNLSMNSISGEIPTSIGGCHILTSLSVAHNHLSGPIPTELSQIHSLTFIDLSNNNLSGSIPAYMVETTYLLFDVSNNNLSGMVQGPLGCSSMSSNFTGNPNLIVPKLCYSLTDQGERTSSSNIRLVVVIVVLGVCVALLIVALMVSKYRKRKKARIAVVDDWTVISFQRLGFKEEKLVESLDEKNLIGCGASGRVYKVVPLESGGKVVAVKKLTPSSAMSNCRGNFSAMVNSSGVQVKTKRDEVCAFKAEMEIVGKLKHKNIVNLMCAYASKEEKMIVYEYMCNGSLGDVLHKAFRKELVCWATRLQIALGAAEGLAYLHHGCEPPVLHRDIKSNNILLDFSFDAKLADFGVAKLFQGKRSMTGVVGSVGYIAPEYAYTLKVDEKSDVYSYGVVLLELVTGRSPTSEELQREGIDLVRWVGQLAQSKEDILKVLDCRLEVGQSDKESMCIVLKLALFCTSIFPRQRPSMREVVELLHRAMKK